MQDRPDAGELAAAIADFLRSEVLPALDDPRLRFRLRVAINGISMLQREAAQSRPLLRRECTLLAEHLGMADPADATAAAARELNAELARRLRAGVGEPDLRLLEELVTLKLAIASPEAPGRYPRETRTP